MQGDTAHDRTHEGSAIMRPKQIFYTAAVALAVVVGFNAYAAKKG
jgi:hypothetical protein